MNKMKTSNILKALKADYDAASVLRKELDGKIDQWKREYNGEPYGNETKGKSQIVSRDIKKQSEWQHASIIEPFVSNPDIIKATPITFEDRPSARQNELLLNTQFCRQFNRYNFMSKAAKVLDQEGTAVVMTGWEYDEEEVEVEIPLLATLPDGSQVPVGSEMSTEIVVTKNQPTAKVVRNEDVFIDPTCQDNMDNCQFVVYRYETDMSTLKQDGRYKNLDKVRVSDNNSGYDDYDAEDDTSFSFSDDPRKKLVVYEYWGNYDINEDGVAEPIVCAWINDTVIRLQDNPYPDKKPPFIVVPFNSVPFQLHGEANAELISDAQKIKTAIYRGLIDNMARSNNGQVGIKKGALDAINRKRFFKGESFEYNTNASDFWSGSYNQIPASAFNTLNLMNNEIESITGIKSFSQGISGSSLGSTATGARGALDATATRRLNIVRNIAENLIKPLMRKWMSYNSEFLEDSQVIRITNEEFVEIKRDDLEGRIDIDIAVSTSEDNSAKAQELAFMLQTTGQDDPQLRKLILAEIARLQKMPDFAKKLEEYQPQPDPVQQELAAIQLENAKLQNAKLQAEIQEKMSRATENGVDVRKKTAEAILKEAQARKMDSETDLKDLEFLEKESGTDVSKQLQLKDFDRMSKLDEKAFDQLNTRKGQ